MSPMPLSISNPLAAPTTPGRGWLVRTGLWALLCLLLGAAWPGPARAAAPANDACSGAITIPGSGPFPFFAAPVPLTEATVAGIEATLTNLASGFCQTVSRGVWYTFTPTTNAFYTLATCSGGSTLDDTVIALFTSAGGCSGPFTRLECADDSCGPGGLQSSITRQLLKDTTYYLVIWKYDTDAPLPGQETVQLTVIRELPPANDICASAQPVFLDTRISGSTILASNDYQLAGSACFNGIGQTAVAGAGRDVVYSFTAPTAGTYSIKAFNYSFASGFNLLLYAASGCLGGTRPITVTNCLAAANRNGASTAEEIPCLPLAAGQQIFIFVDDAVGTNRGSSFTLEVNRCTRESGTNDTPATANPYVCAIQGSISPLGDSDFFTLGLNPAGSRLFALVDGEAANLTDFDLRVTTLTNTLEYDNGDNDTQFGASSPNVAGTPLPREPAFLRVNYNGSLQAEPYRLYAVVQPPPAHAAAESEPNNSTPAADTDPRGYYAGTLAGPSPSNDADVFSFVAEEGDLVFVSLDADPLRDGTPINAQLELLDGFGNTLVVVNDGNNSSLTNTQPGNIGANLPTAPGEGLVYRCAEGTYFVRVSISPIATGLVGAGDYLLSISRNCLAGSTRPQAARCLSLASQPDGRKLLQVQGTPGGIYRVEWSTDLLQWTPFDARVADANGLFTAEDASPSPAHRFYRVVAP